MSPASVRASAAANWNVPTARSASTRAVLIGLAASAAISSANSSRRSASRRAALSRTSARFQRGSGPAASAALADGHGPVDVGGAAHRHPSDLGAVERRGDDGRLRAGEPLAGQRDRPHRGSRRSWVDHTATRGQPNAAPAPLPRLAGAHRVRPPRRGQRGPGEHAAGVRAGRSGSATTTSRPTSTPPPTASSWPSTTTTCCAPAAGPGTSPSCRGGRWRRPGSTGASRSRCSPTCSTRCPTARFNIDCKTDRVVGPLGDELRRTGAPRPGVRRLVQRPPAGPHPPAVRTGAVHELRLGRARRAAGRSASPAPRSRPCRRPVPLARSHARRPSGSSSAPTGAASRSTCGRSTTPPRCPACSTSASTGS